MRLHFILVRRVPAKPSPVLAEVYDRLTRRGFTVDAAIPEEHLTGTDRLTLDHDVYVLKSHTELALSLAGVLDGLGARMINPYASCSAAQNKIVATRMLRDAGVPVPRSWITGDPSLLADLVAETPLIVKPYMGHRGAGIHVVRSGADVEALPAFETPMIVQEMLQGPGEDLKVYVAGEQVFAVRKPFSETSFSVPGRPVPVTSEIREIALACGRASGLGLYGLDVIETEAGPYVVDLNYFPGYKGVPDAAVAIADYIEAEALRGAFSLEPMQERVHAAR